MAILAYIDVWLMSERVNSGVGFVLHLIALGSMCQAFFISPTSIPPFTLVRIKAKWL
ncbi:MAG: hypothetical protein ACJA0B_000676 [Alcanivorax borkumensis]|jgi:hypothetical protein